MPRCPLLCILFLLLASCGSLRPAAAPLPTLTEQLRADWQQLAQRHMADEQRQELIARYNERLLQLLREEGAAHAPDAAPYEELRPAANVELRRLSERVGSPGLGVPMVGILPAEPLPEGELVRTQGIVRQLTAVLCFDAAGSPCLRLLPRRERADICIGPLRYGLASDDSAPMEVYWALTHPAKDRLLGLLRPQKMRVATGLSSMEGYDARKIPLILTHGLASSSETFAELVNRLNADPVVREHYQCWFFNYPTGVSWVVTAESYRRALAELRRKVDPQRRNPHWRKMVLLGHSMGGLITQYSQCEQPWLMLRHSGSFDQEKLEPLMSARYIDRPLPVAAAEPFRANFYFRPVDAGMVVYLATPHRGAPLATYRISELLTRLVQLPQNLAEEALRLVTLQDGMLLMEPRRLTDWFTSVSQLSPESYSIRGLQGLAVRRAPTHSVIGNQGSDAPLPETSDGIVPYWSSHLPIGSEYIVPCGHSVQEDPATARTLTEILRGYAEPTSAAPAGHARLR
ncbi:MAG: esterase/lipase family protein [Akkermansia sp.]